MQFKKENGEEITHNDLFKKLKSRIATEAPYKKFQRKTKELRVLGFIKGEGKDQDKFNVEITPSGLEALRKAEVRKKEVMAEIITLLGPEKIQSFLPLCEAVAGRVDREILK